MMRYAPLQNRSWFKETFHLIKTTKSEWWPWVLIFGLFLGALYIVLGSMIPHMPIKAFLAAHPGIEDHMDLLKQNQALYKQYTDATEQSIRVFFGYGSICFIGFTVVFSVAYYFFCIMQMRVLFPDANITYSSQGYFYWLGKVLWKYIRPVLWCLIPFIGAFFYLRSLLRYSAVSPLALLQTGDEFNISKNLTKGFLWRILGNQFLVGGAGGLVGMAVGLIVGIPMVILTVVSGHDLKTPHGYMAFISILKGMTSSLGILIGASFISVLYRSLSARDEEKRTLPTQATMR